VDAGDETVTHTLLAPNATNSLRTDRLSSIYLYMHLVKALQITVQAISEATAHKGATEI
jgi:hypothetical protein